MTDSVLKRFEIALELCAKNLQLTDFERGLIEPFVVSTFSPTKNQIKILSLLLF